MSAIVLDKRSEMDGDFVRKPGMRVVSSPYAPKKDSEKDALITKLSGEVMDLSSKVTDELSGNVDGLVEDVDDIYDALTAFTEDIGYLSGAIDDLDYELKRKGEFTAFEVSIHDDLKTHKFYLRTMHRKEYNNCIVDWGDGTETIVNEMTNEDYYKSKKNTTDSDLTSDTLYNRVSEYNVNMSHTYADDGKYIVKIYGDTYWGLMSQASTSPGTNRVSRIFDYDLPLNPCVTDLASWCDYATDLNLVEAPNYYDFSHVINWSSAFKNCTGLSVFHGGDKQKFFTQRIYAAGSMFANCTNLIDSNVALPGAMTNGGYSNFYSGCANLSTNITTLIPAIGIIGGSPKFDSAFYGCGKITGHLSAVEHLLWYSPMCTQKWTASNCFKNSSLSTEAPTTWGGTKAAPAGYSKGYVIEDMDTLLSSFEDLAKSEGYKVTLNW